MRLASLVVIALLIAAGPAAGQAPPLPAPVVATIIQVAAAPTGSDILVNAGLDDGVAAGWKGKIDGTGIRVVLSSCTRTTCRARIQASVATVRRASKSVVLRAP